MKTISLFVCEKCGTQYSAKIDAEDCENNHKTPDCLFSARYISKKQDCTGLPVSIEVKFKNGQTATYKR